MTRSRPKLPSEKRKTDYDNSDKRLDDCIKELNDILNNVKNKQLRNLVYEKINDTVDSPDIDFSPKFDFSPGYDSLRKTIDEINKKQSDQIDFDKLRDLMKKINSIKPYKQTDFTIRSPPKVFDSTIEKLYKPSKPSQPSKPSEPHERRIGAGERAAVRVKELTVKIYMITLYF